MAELLNTLILNLRSVGSYMPSLAYKCGHIILILCTWAVKFHLLSCLIHRIYIIINWLSSSFCATSTDLSDPLSPPVSNVHRAREVFQATSCIGTKLLYIGSSRSCNRCSSMWKGPQEYIAYEFVLTSPAVSSVSGPSDLDSFRDGR